MLKDRSIWGNKTLEAAEAIILRPDSSARRTDGPVFALFRLIATEMLEGKSSLGENCHHIIIDDIQGQLFEHFGLRNYIQLLNSGRTITSEGTIQTHWKPSLTRSSATALHTVHLSGPLPVPLSMYGGTSLIYHPRQSGGHGFRAHYTLTGPRTSSMSATQDQTSPPGTVIAEGIGEDEEELEEGEIPAHIYRAPSQQARESASDA